MIYDRYSVKEANKQPTWRIGFWRLCLEREREGEKNSQIPEKVGIETEGLSHMNASQLAQWFFITSEFSEKQTTS